MTITIQTTIEEAGGAAPRVIIGGTSVAIDRLPVSAQQAIQILTEGVALASTLADTRYLLTVANGVVQDVQEYPGVLDVGDPATQLYLVAIKNRQTGAVLQVQGRVLVTGEAIMTNKPHQLAAVLASGGYGTETLTSYLAGVPADPDGTTLAWLVVYRLQQAALSQAAVGIDASAVAAYVANNGLDSPEEAGPELFAQVFAAALSGWQDKWRRPLTYANV